MLPCLLQITPYQKLVQGSPTNQLSLNRQKFPLKELKKSTKALSSADDVVYEQPPISQVVQSRYLFRSLVSLASNII